MQIRRAQIEDARAIHDAHMRSIREVCAPDYTQEQVDAWGGRPFDQSDREKCIREDFMWVVEDNGSILGFAHLRLPKDKLGVGNVMGLYFAPEAKGKGLGRQMAQRVEGQASSEGCHTLILNSTITSLEFYKKMGFQQTSPQICHAVRGVGIPCYPMEKKLK